jgi:hypothetical protein
MIMIGAVAVEIGKIASGSVFIDVVERMRCCLPSNPAVVVACGG